MTGFPVHSLSKRAGILSICHCYRNLWSFHFVRISYLQLEPTVSLYYQRFAQFFRINCSRHLLLF